MGRYELNNDKLKEFSICDEFEIGVNITDDEISKMAKEILALQEQNNSLRDEIFQISGYILENDNLKNQNEALQETFDRQVEFGAEKLRENVALEGQNKNMEQTIDMQHETTISDLKLIGKLQQENKDLIEDTIRIAKYATHNTQCCFRLDEPIIEGSEICNCGYYDVIQKHNALNEKHNNKTT